MSLNNFKEAHYILADALYIVTTFILVTVLYSRTGITTRDYFGGGAIFNQYCCL